MRETEKKLRMSMTCSGDTIRDRMLKGMTVVAEGIDEIKDIIKNSHNIQMVGSQKSDLGDKKAKALMIIIGKMIARYQTFQHLYGDGRLDEEIFKLFEKAKAIKRAENETDFQSAIADL